jgi:ABC-type antimicrobial peptide transport system permease subunit
MKALIKTNDYSAGIRRLTEEKLREYVEKPEDFHDEAVLAAIWELSQRRPLLTDELRLEEEISSRSQEIEVVSIPEVIKTDFRADSPNLPSLYSIGAIQLFSVLFSVLGGGILMAINFSKTTRRIEAIKVLGFSVSYTIISLLIFSLMGTQSAILSIVLNLLGAFLIDQLFWKRVLGLDFRFKKRQVWSALIIAMVIISPLIWYVLKTGAVQTL